jgi:ABC transport system ATP-binding/permease protein
LGIIGNNGTGKTTFLNLLNGTELPDGGKIVVGDTVKLGYYTQKGINLKQDKRVIEVITDIAEFIQLEKGKKLTANHLLELFLFNRDKQYAYVSTLSGGEKKRLYLLTVLMQNPNFLILDEPTNDLDIPTMNVLENYLMNYNGCIIVVTHDRYFMDKITDHLFVFKGDGIIDSFIGNYSDYIQKKQIEQQY